MDECNKENCKGNLAMLHRCQELAKEDMVGRAKAEKKLREIRIALNNKSKLYDGDEMDKLEDCERILDDIRIILDKDAIDGCLFCKNPTWTWVDFMRENCGKENYGVDDCCNEHGFKFISQLLEKKKNE